MPLLLGRGSLLAGYFHGLQQKLQDGIIYGCMNIVDPSPDDLTLGEAIQVAGCSRSTLRVAIRRGQLPRRYAHGPHGLQLVFARADLQAWLAASPAPLRGRPQPGGTARSGKDSHAYASAKLVALERSLQEAQAAIRALQESARAQQDSLNGLREAVRAMIDRYASDERPGDCTRAGQSPRRS